MLKAKIHLSFTAKFTKYLHRADDHVAGLGIPVRYSGFVTNSDRWQVIRIGADIKIKCLGCGRVVMMERPEFEKRRKKILEQGPVPEAETLRQMAGQFEGGTR